MKKSFIYLLSLTLFVSCANKNTSNVKPNNFVINNKILRDNVIGYYNKYLNGANTEGVITIDFSQNGDTSIFVISHDLSLFGLIKNPPLLYCKMNNIDIAVRSKLTPFIVMEDVDQEKELKEHFPSQFLEYKINGEVPPPATFICEEWILKFIENRFLTKTINQ